jgi:hypothetical protein
MLGYYCIYECSKNQWLMENQWWQKDRSYTTERIGVKHGMTITQNFADPSNPIVNIFDIESRNVVIEDTNNGINKHSIKKFSTINEAESYLLNSPFSTNEGQFYSIRKIYF